MKFYSKFEKFLFFALMCLMFVTCTNQVNGQSTSNLEDAHYEIARVPHNLYSQEGIKIYLPDTLINQINSDYDFYGSFYCPVCGQLLIINGKKGSCLFFKSCGTCKTILKPYNGFGCLFAQYMGKSYCDNNCHSDHE